MFIEIKDMYGYNNLVNINSIGLIEGVDEKYYDLHIGNNKITIGLKTYDEIRQELKLKNEVIS